MHFAICQRGMEYIRDACACRPIKERGTIDLLLYNRRDTQVAVQHLQSDGAKFWRFAMVDRKGNHDAES